MILHHYPMSPFSEKVRALFGYANLDWQSVRVPEMPPRRHLDPLTGGYRKIPVAQDGADIFCDTRIICAEVADRAGKPELAVEHCSTVVRDFVHETDLDVFFALVLSADGKTLIKQLWKDTSTWHVIKFIRDRVSMGRKGRVKAPTPAQAKAIVRAHLEKMETMLDKDFLFGDTPNNADFAAYHGLWFIRDLSGSSYISRFPRVDAWLDRIKAFGHGSMTAITPADALAAARSVEPRPLPANTGDRDLLGKKVRVAPTDYGQVPVTGILMAATDHRVILRRETEGVGTVHVHFPRQDFSVQQA
ncbi:MAG: glutathione S-transferase family protein [Alcanivoracaceae bacterium]|jgi:glutathione S-transferase|nr:glutathione S-transferase family protein [Alcanivoracaceae bacterium]